MHIDVLKLSKLLAFIAGGGLTAGFAATGDPKLIAAGVIVTTLAAAVGQLFPNAATAVVPDAPIVNAAGKTVGINVSTTSTLPLAAPKGP